MSVSRDFIDSYSPEASTGPGRNGQPLRREARQTRRAEPRPGNHCRATTLVFGFHGCEDLLKTLISLRKSGGLLLGLRQEVLQRLVQADRLVDVGACARPVG